MEHRLCHLLAAAALLATVAPAAGMIYNTGLRPLRTTLSSGQYVPIVGPDAFGFEAGGSFSIDIDCNGPTGNLSLVLLSRTAYRDVTDSSKNLCTLDFVRQVLLNSSLLPDSTALEPHYFYNTSFGEPESRFSDGFYTFLLLECAPFPYNEQGDSMPPPAICGIHAVTLNPGGEHLSSDEIKLPGIYRGFTIFWATILIIWTLMGFYYHKFLNKLTLFLSVGPVLKLITLWLQATRYSQLSEEGIENESLNDARIALTYLENTVMILTLVLIAEGWCIIRFNLSSESIYTSILPTTLFFITNILTEFVHSYFLGLSIVLIILIAVHVLRQASLNVFLLKRREHEIHVVEMRNPDLRRDQNLPLAYPLICKRYLIYQARVAFVTYAMMWAILGIAQSFMEEKKWLEFLLFEIMEVVVYVWLLFLFRMRDFSKFFTNSGEPTQAQHADNDEEPTTKCSLVQYPGRAGVTNMAIPIDRDLFQAYMHKQASYHRRGLFADFEHMSPALEDENDDENFDDAEPGIAEARI